MLHTEVTYRLPLLRNVYGFAKSKIPNINRLIKVDIFYNEEYLN